MNPCDVKMSMRKARFLQDDFLIYDATVLFQAKDVYASKLTVRICFKITGELPSASKKEAVKAGKSGYERRASAASISYDGRV